jgi:hypothetical protein
MKCLACQVAVLLSLIEIAQMGKCGQRGGAQDDEGERSPV